MNAQDGTCFCSKAELDLFATPPVNVSMERGDYAVHRTLATITETSPLEFFVPGSPEEYIDLGRTNRRLQLKIVKASDGSNPAGNATLSTVNLLLHSLFSQVDCKLNQKLVTPSINTYPYKAYLETLLAHGHDSAQTWLAAEMFYPDSGDVNEHDPAQNTNPGLVSRNARVKEGRVVELVGRPHIDVFQQDKYLLNGVDISLKFTRANKAFTLMSDHPEHYRINILEAALYVRKVKINPTISIEHNKTLQQGITAKYPLRRGVVNTFTIPQGNLSYNKENLITGQLPRRIILGFVTNRAFNGHGQNNPFNFQNLRLNYLTVNTDNQQFPSQPLQPNYANEETVREFHQLYSGLGLINSNSGVGVTLDQFMKGHTLYAIDLTPDMAEGPHVDPIKYGNLRLEAHFETALTNPINCICYAEYDNMIQIDSARNVIADFAPS